MLSSQLAFAQQPVRTIFLVRHAEKVSNDPDATLSPAGLKRAECLAGMLKDAGIKEILVSDKKRTQQTAEPLAQSLKITPKILPANDYGNLTRNALYQGNGNVLIVGHGDTLPNIIARMKAGNIAPIADNDYERLYEITAIEGSVTPVVTLHYCQAGGPPASSAKPAASPSPKKTPSKK